MNNNEYRTIICKILELNIHLTPYKYEELNLLKEKYKYEDFINAIEIAKEKGIRNINYIITCVKNGVYNFKKEEKSEKVPSWFHKEIKKEELSKEEQIQMEELMKDFR